MAKAILSPPELWQDFDDTLPLEPVVLQETLLGESRVQHVLFSGRDTGAGRPRIFALFAGPADDEVRPAILIVPDVGARIDETYVLSLVQQGYRVLAVDYYGKRADAEHFTQYPDVIPYANYEQRGTHADVVEDTVRETSWYEWTAAIRYGKSFLSARMDVESDHVFLLGIRGGAEIGWQVVAFSEGLAGAALISGAGWESYRNCFKYSDTTPEMNDERFSWIAGVEAQSYAQYAKCPVLFLGATNDVEFCFDRARDTLARVNAEVPVYGDFTPNSTRGIDKTGCDNILSFFDAICDHRLPEKRALPVTVEVVNGCVYLYTDDAEGDISVWYSCATVDPVLRTWHKAVYDGNTEEGKRRYLATLTDKEGVFLAYSRFKQNGLCVSSPQTSCFLQEQSVTVDASASRIVYAEGKTELLVPAEKENPVAGFVMGSANRVVKKGGANKINGVTCGTGLRFFIGKRMPLDQDRILMMNVFTQADLRFTVTFIYGFGREEVRYYQQKTLSRMNGWQKVCLECKSFKRENGMPFKEEIFPEAVVIEGDGEHLINNVLWI